MLIAVWNVVAIIFNPLSVCKLRIRLSEKSLSRISPLRPLINRNVITSVDLLTMMALRNTIQFIHSVGQII